MTARQTLKRDLLPFAAGKEEGHLGHVKAVVMLDQDNRFVLRLKKEYWVLVEEPTPDQTQSIKAAILELIEGEI